MIEKTFQDMILRVLFTFGFLHGSLLLLIGYNSYNLWNKKWFMGIGIITIFVLILEYMYVKGRVVDVG